MKRSTLIGISFLVVLPFLLIALFSPVDISKENSIQITGKVEAITEGPSYDVMVKLKDNPTIYYVNRGFERGLELTNLRETLVGREIEFWHAKSWQSAGGHITQLKIREEIVYRTAFSQIFC